MNKIKLKKSFNTTFQQFIYTDGNSLNYDFVDLALQCKTLTFDKRFLNPALKILIDTPFKEIKWATSEQICNKNYLYLLNNQPEYKNQFYYYLGELWNALKEFIIDIWDSEGKYLILHSSGYDSRIISSVLAELRDEGMEMGHIYFRCHQSECENFFKIMKIEGWQKDQYSCFYSSNEDHYNLGVPHISTNGFLGYFQQMNFWSDIIPEHEEKNWYLVNGWEGAYFKYIAMGNSNDNKINCFKNYQINPQHYWMWQGQWITRFKDMIQPFCSYKYLNIVMKIKYKWCKQISTTSDNIRIELLKLFNYDLSEIPRGMHNYNLKISKKRKKEMLNLYYNSEFYKISKIKINLFEDMFGWDARLWGFAVTVYEKIYKKIHEL